MIHETISPSQVRHVLRYVNACKWLEPGMRVLDIACGNGYGTAIIHRKCKDVFGWDSNHDAITAAVNGYLHLKGQFYMHDLLKPFPAARAEAIVSLETIEHFTPIQAAELLKKFHAAIYSNGFLVLSTPYCAVSGPSQVNPEHLYEYTLTNLEQLLVSCGFVVDCMQLDRHPGQDGRLGYVMLKANKI